MNNTLKLNGVEFNKKFDFFFLLKFKFEGINFFFFYKLFKRFELNKNKIDLDFEDDKIFISFFKFINNYFPENALLSNLKIINILFLNLVWSYKGWRHFKGLPCRGQRTWSNAWSSFRSNLILRNFKKKTIKTYYGKIGGPEQRLCFISEYINYLWKNQWFSEWLYSRKNIKTLLKKKKYLFKFDVYATAKGLLGNIKKNLDSVTKKKKKLLTGSVGFDVGFSKLYLKIKYNMTKKNRKKWKKIKKKLNND